MGLLDGKERDRSGYETRFRLVWTRLRRERGRAWGNERAEQSRERAKERRGGERQRERGRERGTEREVDEEREAERERERNTQQYVERRKAPTRPRYRVTSPTRNSPPPLAPPQGPGHIPNVGPQRCAVSYE